MEVQCLEMWSKVKIEKLQNDPSLVRHKKMSVLMKEFPNVSLVVMHSNMGFKQTCAQANKEQTNKHVWAFKNRTQTI